MLRYESAAAVGCGMTREGVQKNLENRTLRNCKTSDAAMADPWHVGQNQAGLHLENINLRKHDTESGDKICRKRGHSNLA